MLLDIIRQSLSTLWAHKLRSFLTMFGIAWGVGSLLLLVGLGEGFRSGQEKQLATLGQDIMFMFPGRIAAVEGSTQSGQTYYFTYKDYLAIRGEAQFVGALSPVLNREDIRAVSDYGSTNGQVFGVAADYNQIRNVPVSPGRWFNNQDGADRRRVAVVGWELLKNMKSGKVLVLTALVTLCLAAGSVSSAAAQTFTISVAVSGLTGGTLVVQDSLGDTLSFTTNNTQTFATGYAAGTHYTVTGKTQPVGQTCQFSSNSRGTINSNITVNVTCVPSYKISVKPTGLVGTLVVADDKGDTLTFTTNTSQSFTKKYNGGSSYSVTIQTQPAGQTCTLGSNASGTINSNITVTATCANSNPTISVTTTGLAGTLVVHDDKNENLTFTTNTTQTFPTSYTSGSTYTVTIQTQPTNQTCTLSSNATGTITSNITVTATCISNFKINVAVTGLAGTVVVHGAAIPTMHQTEAEWTPRFDQPSKFIVFHP